MPEREAVPHAACPAPSARGLAVCLMALAGEAQALPNPFAAHLIAAAAAALLETDEAARPAPAPQGPFGAE
jgi:hypothetical protein